MRWLWECCETKKVWVDIAQKHKKTTVISRDIERKEDDLEKRQWMLILCCPSLFQGNWTHSKARHFVHCYAAMKKPFGVGSNCKINGQQRSPSLLSLTGDRRIFDDQFYILSLKVTTIKQAEMVMANGMLLRFRRYVESHSMWSQSQ